MGKGIERSFENPIEIGELRDLRDLKPNSWINNNGNKELLTNISSSSRFLNNKHGTSLTFSIEGDYFVEKVYLLHNTENAIRKTFFYIPLITFDEHNVVYNYGQYIDCLPKEIREEYLNKIKLVSKQHGS